MLGKPGHSPNNIVEGGGISKRLLQITSFSAMFFYARIPAGDPAGNFRPNPQPAGKAFPRKFGTKNPERANKAANATGFIVIFASGFFNAYT